MADQRSHTAGRFVLDVDGWRVGFLKKFSGLAMEADIVSHDMGPQILQKKNVANIKWTPMKATVGIGMGKGMYDWIKSAFDMNYLTKNATFTAGDFNYKAQSQITAMNGLITGVTVPALSGDSKEAAYFDIEADFEQVRHAKGGGEDIRGNIGVKQKAWLCSNFRVEIDGLPCDRVAKVDSFTWKCSVTQDQVGIFREPTKHPAKVIVPDLKLSISYADHDAWAKKAEDWFVKGKHLEGDELGGRIVFLDPNMKDELGEITLHNLGLKKFSDEDSTANDEKIKRFSVELYCEKMDFVLKYTDA
jgi:hypothetical protein